jgi:hypothetical protein
MISKFGHVIMTSTEARGIVKAHQENEATIERMRERLVKSVEYITSYQRITDGLVEAILSIPCECDEIDGEVFEYCARCKAMQNAQSVVAEHSLA